MEQATLSFCMTSTEIGIEHNNRTIPVPHSDISRQCDNYYWSGNKSLQTIFTELFSSDVEEYNARQKRKDRKIDDYLGQLTEALEKEKKKLKQLRVQGATKHTLRQNTKAKKVCYEFVVTIGNLRDNPSFNAVNGERKYEAREILQRYVEDFAKRYNGREFGIELANAAIHLCENGQVHLHCDLVFHSNDNKRGMRHQVSMNGALKQLGFCGDEKTLPITEWENYERGILTELCAEYNIEIIAGKGSKKHQHKEEYILSQEKLRNEERGKALDEQEEKFNDFLLRSESGNAFLLLQENDELREELTDLQAQEENQQERLAQLWEEYKGDNSQYWERYKENKAELKKEIALVVSQKNYDKERMIDLLNSVVSGNGFIFSRLFRLICALFLKFKVDREEQQLRQLQELNRRLKEEARLVCSASQQTAQALKSEDFTRIYETMRLWENLLSTVNLNLENMIEPNEAQLENNIER